MPRFVIERNFDPLDEEEMETIGALSKKLLDEKYTEIRWEHSHVVADAEGNIKTFCIYEAPGEEAIRAHAQELGHHMIDKIYEIGADVDPREIKTA